MILFVSLVIIIIIICYMNKGIPSILYHQVNDLSNVNPKLFESHVEYLIKKNYKGITISDYENKEYSKKDKNIMLTFDDGYYDNYLNVFPILKKYNMKATIFLNTFYISEKERKNHLNILESREANREAALDYVENGKIGSEQYMNWSEIREMHESGLVDFQAHSHKHFPIFTSHEIIGIHKESTGDSSDIFLYGRETKKGDPIFRKRGECSTKGYKIAHEFFDKFNEFYHENKDVIGEDLKEYQKFVDKYLGTLIIGESSLEAKERIKEESFENKKEIEEKLGNSVTSFCWPWGHKSDFGIEIMKEVGYKQFVTTKKGTNSIRGNSQKIRRIELRKFTLKKFILNVNINRSLILGRLYELVS